MLHHFGVHPGGWLDWGPIAPTLFFVLSGYLMFSSLEKLRAAPGGVTLVSLVAFHLRRLARLVPALYLLLAVGAALGTFYYIDNWLWHALFLSNVMMAFTGEWSGTLSHLWSLSVQEQFYLICPVLLFFPARWVVTMLFGVVAFAVGFRVAGILAGWSDMVRWLLLPASLDAFAMGALIACARRRGVRWLGRLAGWPALAGAAGAFAISRILRHLEGTGNPFLALVEVFEVVAISLLLLTVLDCIRHPVTRLLALKPLADIGRISYGIFIWHMLVGVSLAPVLDSFSISVVAQPFLHVSLLVAASIGMAWLSWVSFEQPCVRWAAKASAVLGPVTNRWERWVAKSAQTNTNT
ncbi:MAG: acyltransferase [Terrimicrobiaceae bacterium]